MESFWFVSANIFQINPYLWAEEFAEERIENCLLKNRVNHKNDFQISQSS
jgi:hypothetical protein